MEDSLLMDAIERYVRGEMSMEEALYFSELRNNNPEVDQAVVEHLFFLNQINQFKNARDFRHNLLETENKLINEGLIHRTGLMQKAPVVKLWQKYKRTIAVAASIAGVVSLFIATLIASLRPTNTANIKPLVDKLHQQENKTRQIERKVNQLEAEQSARPAVKVDARFRATGFLLDAANNYLVTNAHVVREARNQLVVENNNGQQFFAESVYLNPATDIAILKITDSSFKKLSAYPYSIRKSAADLGDQVFMLGFPKQEIVYGEGYVSARNGYLMDTIYCQLNTAANEGTSGSPVINKNGELIGIISSRETNSDGVVFAIKSEHIFKAIEAVREIEGHQDIKITSAPALKGLDRVTQIKKIDDYVFMIKGN